MWPAGIPAVPVGDGWERSDASTRMARTAGLGRARAPPPPRKKRKPKAAKRAKHATGQKEPTENAGHRAATMPSLTRDGRTEVAERKARQASSTSGGGTVHVTLLVHRSARDTCFRKCPRGTPSSMWLAGIPVMVPVPFLLGMAGSAATIWRNIAKMSKIWRNITFDRSEMCLNSWSILDFSAIDRKFNVDFAILLKIFRTNVDFYIFYRPQKV